MTDVLYVEGNSLQQRFSVSIIKSLEVSQIHITQRNNETQCVVWFKVTFKMKTVSYFKVNSVFICSEQPEKWRQMRCEHNTRETPQAGVSFSS